MTLPRWTRPISRRRLLALGGSAVLGALLTSRARAATRIALRLGAVLPIPSGEGIVRASINDFTGAAARRGAILANERIGDEADRSGFRVDVLQASSPRAEAAERAGRRMVATEEVQVLIGGIGSGQAEVLAAVAEEEGILFFNIGSSSDALRGDACVRHTFHMEASAAMYLDALVLGTAAGQPRRWFVFHEAGDEGMRLLQRASQAIATHDGGEVVGSAAVHPEQPVYYPELEQVRAARPEVVLALIEARDQFALIGQAETLGVEAEVLAYPEAITQTRDYIAASRQITPGLHPRRRAALWETTLDVHDAGVLNDRFISRWGEPMEPTAWAAYESVRVAYEAMAATGTTDAGALIEYLESPEAVLPLHKGPGTSFRPWDHQLRQPLYVVEVDDEAPWRDLVLSSRIAVAGNPSVVPEEAEPAGDPVERLDLLGDGADASDCSF